MRIKALIIILIVLVTLITAFVGVKQPTLHKQTMFSDEYHKFEEVELPASNIAITTVTPKPAVQQQSMKQLTQQKPEKVIYEQPKPVAKPQPTKQVTKQQAKPQTQKVIQEPKPQPKVVQEPKPKENKPHQLTEQEEIIAWNKWRSNLQNQVMKDAPTRAPLGTVFKFSFTVDKYGNMSNIKVWSENPNYTDLAVRVIKPVLTGYAHKPILNFPQGTKRVITNVTGGYVISTRTKYSSPSDYSDYEKVKRYK